MFISFQDFEIVISPNYKVLGMFKIIYFWKIQIIFLQFFLQNLKLWKLLKNNWAQYFSQDRNNFVIFFPFFFTSTQSFLYKNLLPYHKPVPQRYYQAWRQNCIATEASQKTSKPCWERCEKQGNVIILISS